MSIEPNKEPYSVQTQQELLDPFAQPLIGGLGTVNEQGYPVYFQPDLYVAQQIDGVDLGKIEFAITRNIKAYLSPDWFILGSIAFGTFLAWKSED